MKKVFFFAVFTAVITNVSTIAADLSILPEKISLNGPEARQHFLVLEKDGEEFSGEVPAQSLSVKDEAVATIENGVVVPKGNGVTTLIARTEKGEVSVPIEVNGFDAKFTWSFRHHVLPVISKEGCNAGACHGALAGKGGFRLSLRGYDPPKDFYTIARETGGRRIESADPARSLLITKPTMATPHKGGKRMDPRSRDYRILAEWITAGAKAPSEEDVVVDRIEVLPEISNLKPGDKQKILVTAFYDDGSTQDATQWAKFTSADETVATVDDDGNVEVIGYGVGSITAWFSSKVKLARIVSPFPNQIPDEVYTQAEKQSFIDELVLQQLQSLNLKPSRRTTDNEFVRRAFLDTIGMVPSSEEVTKFLADKDPKKRDKLIDHLLTREEFTDYWAYRWSDVFLVNGGLLRPDAVKSYYEWVRTSVEKNTPWDQMAREIITAKGGSIENGATNFYAVHQDPETMAENVSQAFLGLSLACAKCHDHPLEKWTNDQYYAFANLFSRVRGKGWGGDTRNGDGIRTLYVEPRGDLIQPRTGKPQIPAPLDGDPIDPDSTEDRREALAVWLTSPDNTFFSRAVTNRVWAAYFGIGLVNEVDDLRASNPASNEPLLEALAAYLVENEFDLKALMKLILQSETYQRSSEVSSENRDDPRFFSRHYPRRHMAEVLHDAIAEVSDVPSVFTKLKLNDGSTQDTKFYEEGTRALELYDSAVESYFLKTFGRNERDIVCECERSNQPSMIQVLHLANGSTLNEKLQKKDGIVDQLLKKNGADFSALVDAAYLRTLSRNPTKKEKDGFIAMIGKAPEEERHEAVEDLFWALMTSREFLFQH